MKIKMEYASHFTDYLDFNFVDDFEQIVEHVEKSKDKYQKIFDLYIQTDLNRDKHYIKKEYFENFTLEDLLHNDYDEKFENIMKNWYYCYDDEHCMSNPDCLDITNIWYSLITYFVKTNQFEKYRLMMDAISWCDRDTANWANMLNIISLLLPDNKFFIFTLKRFWCKGFYDEVCNTTKISSKIVKNLPENIKTFLNNVIISNDDISNDFDSYYYGKDGDCFVPNVDRVIYQVVTEIENENSFTQFCKMMDELLIY